jgi:hypothetical protein
VAEYDEPGFDLLDAFEKMGTAGAAHAAALRDTVTVSIRGAVNYEYVGVGRNEGPLTL